jgi:nucleotide-binding universal stress UspA family protein
MAHVSLRQPQESAMVFSPKHILVPVDADPTGDRALAERLVDDAVAFARLVDGRLTLLHVALPLVSPMSPPADLISEAYRAMLDVVEARNAASGRLLKELAERAERVGVGAHTMVSTRPGSIAETIADIAKEEHADLIMMTTHGRRGVRRVLLGSVAERTAHLAHVPVLLLPPVDG